MASVGNKPMKTLREIENFVHTYYRRNNFFYKLKDEYKYDDKFNHLPRGFKVFRRLDDSGHGEYKFTIGNISYHVYEDHVKIFNRTKTGKTLTFPEYNKKYVTKTGKNISIIHGEEDKKYFYPWGKIIIKNNILQDIKLKSHVFLGRIGRNVNAEEFNSFMIPLLLSSKTPLEIIKVMRTQYNITPNEFRHRQTLSKKHITGAQKLIKKLVKLDIRIDILIKKLRKYKKLGEPRLAKTIYGMLSSAVPALTGKVLKTKMKRHLPGEKSRVTMKRTLKTQRAKATGRRINSKSSSS